VNWKQAFTVSKSWFPFLLFKELSGIEYDGEMMQ